MSKPETSANQTGTVPTLLGIGTTGIGTDAVPTMLGICTTGIDS